MLLDARPPKTAIAGKTSHPRLKTGRGNATPISVSMRACSLAEVKPASLIRRYAVSFVVWTAVGAFLVSQRSLFSVSAGTAFHLRSSLAANFPSVWFWALMTPVVFALTQRFPLQRGAWHTNLVLHGLFSLGFESDIWVPGRT